MLESKILEQGIEKYGTPLYIFDTDQVREQTGAFRRILGEKAGLCYAMKANPFLVKQMAELTDRIEVCSMGEFYICKETGIPPEKIFLSGVLKKKEDIWLALDYYQGRCLCNVESPGQFFYIAQWCRRNQIQTGMYLRLASGSQFGMAEETIKRLLSRKEYLPWVKVRGIHYFSGTLKKPERMKKELAYLDGVLRRLGQETGCRIEELEYGPGLSVAYFQGQRDKTLEELQTLAQEVGQMKWKGKIILEMGRAFAASCGCYLTKVEETKRTAGTRFCIVDGGIHQLHYDGQIRGMYHPHIRVLPESQDQEREWNIYGSLCTVHDVLAQKISLKGLRRGKVLVFENTGAYSHMEGMALFLSHELPKAAFYSRKQGWRLIRREQQTYTWNMEREADNGEITGNIKGNQ